MTEEEPLGGGLDPSEIRFRLDSVPAGGWITFIACGGGLAYTAGWADHNRLSLALLFGVGAIGGGIVFSLPWEDIVRKPWRELAFLAWSIGDLLLIIALAALDGGARSPLAVLLFIPIVFASLSYPLTSVVIVSAATLLGYATLAAASQTEVGYTLVFAVGLACTALMSVWQARNHERRRELLAIASRTDPLTGALNRRGYEQAAASQLAAVNRLGYPSSLVLLDLDHFKRYNDDHGHAAGDELLCWVVDRIRGTLRPTDAVARMGGDEFAVLLAGADTAAAEVVVRRIREDLGSRTLTSCGLASAPADGTDIDALYRRADLALYDAKRARVLEEAPSSP